MISAYILELSEWHKLHNVPHGSLACSRAQNAVVSIQELHGTEVCPPYSNNDDGHGKARGVDDGTACLIHVCDHPVSDDQQNKVLLWHSDITGNDTRKRTD